MAQVEMPLLLSLLSGRAVREMVGEGRRTSGYCPPCVEGVVGSLLLKSLDVEVRGKETGPPGSVGGTGLGLWG